MINESTSARIPIRCDIKGCCGDKILAERVGNTIVVKDRRHGVLHTAVYQFCNHSSAG